MFSIVILHPTPFADRISFFAVSTRQRDSTASYIFTSTPFVVSTSTTHSMIAWSTHSSPSTPPSHLTCSPATLGDATPAPTHPHSPPSTDLNSPCRDSCASPPTCEHLVECQHSICKATLSYQLHVTATHLPIPAPTVCPQPSPIP